MLFHDMVLLKMELSVWTLKLGISVAPFPRISRHRIRMESMKALMARVVLLHSDSSKLSIPSSMNFVVISLFHISLTMSCTTSGSIVQSPLMANRKEGHFRSGVVMQKVIF